MGQASKETPDDWILLGTMLHAVQRATRSIQSAETIETTEKIAGALSDFARDMGTISGVTSSERDGITSVTRGGRTAIVGVPDIGTTQDSEPAPLQETANSAVAFGGSLTDPAGLGQQLGTFLSHMMNMGGDDLSSLDDRAAWVDSLFMGISAGIRKEIPIAAIACICARVASQSLAAEMLARHMSGRATFGLRNVSLSEVTPDISLSDYTTDKTPPELRAALGWIDQTPAVVKSVASLIDPEDVERLGYVQTGGPTTRH